MKKVNFGPNPQNPPQSTPLRTPVSKNRKKFARTEMLNRNNRTADDICGEIIAHVYFSVKHILLHICTQVKPLNNGHSRSRKFRLFNFEGFRFFPLTLVPKRAILFSNFAKPRQNFVIYLLYLTAFTILPFSTLAS